MAGKLINSGEYLKKANRNPRQRALLRVPARLLFIAVLSGFLFVQHFTASADSKSSAHPDSEPLLFVGSNLLPPISRLENGQAKGLTVEIVEAIAAGMNRPVKAELMNLAVAEQPVPEGEAGALIQIVDQVRQQRFPSAGSVPVILIALAFILGLLETILKKKQAEKEKDFQISFQQAAADLSAALVGLSDHTSFNRAIDTALERLCTLFGVDRGYLFRFSDDLEMMRLTNEWCAPGVESLADRIHLQQTSALPWWKAQMLQKMPLHIPDISALPPEAEAESREFSGLGIRSLICLPTIGVRGQLTGFIGFDKVGQLYCWKQEKVTMLQLVADTLGSSLERRKAEKDLRQAYENMAAVLENTMFGTAIIDKNRNIRFVNSATCKLAGVEDPETLIGSQCGDYLCPAEQGECPVLDMGQKLDNCERLLCRYDGRLVPILKSVAAVNLGGEDVLLETFIDISDQKLAQDQISEQKERLANIVEGANAGTWEWNLQTGEIIVNEKWAEIIGYTLEELCPVTEETWKTLILPADLEASSLMFEKHFNGELSSYDIEIRMLHKDGRRVWINGRGKVISWTEDGKPLWVFGTLTDITDRKQAEAAIARLNADLERRLEERTVELKAVNKELASLAYSISHDFCAPLRTLDGFSASLQAKYDEQLDEQGRHYLSRIRSTAIYMSNLIDSLLELASITRREFVKQQVDLGAVASAIVAGLQEAEPQRKSMIRIAPGLLVSGDASMLRSALENLLDNAWKFSSREAQTDIEVGRKSIDGEEVFFVRDKGAGFNMAYADKLFGAFQRLHRTGEFPGTGIGLASVQRIINRHGGRIWAESAVGQGATFYFTLSYKDSGS